MPIPASTTDLRGTQNRPMKLLESDGAASVTPFVFASVMARVHTRGLLLLMVSPGRHSEKAPLKQSPFRYTQASDWDRYSSSG